mgnify:CR=1 FL=1
MHRTARSYVKLAVISLFLAVFALAQSFSSMAWQRYYEPFVLMTFALAAARMRDAGIWLPAAVERRLPGADTRAPRSGRMMPTTRCGWSSATRRTACRC